MCKRVLCVRSWYVQERFNHRDIHPWYLTQTPASLCPSVWNIVPPESSDTLGILVWLSLCSLQPHSGYSYPQPFRWCQQLEYSTTTFYYLQGVIETLESPFREPIHLILCYPIRVHAAFNVPSCYNSGIVVSFVTEHLANFVFYLLSRYFCISWLQLSGRLVGSPDYSQSLVKAPVLGIGGVVV